MQKEPTDKTYLRQLVKWTAIGLAIRLILMPITMHGQDLVFINYFPMMFVENGAWDPYGFISANLPHFPWTYYGPVLFIMMSVANFIFVNIFNATSLVKILELSSTMMFRGLETIDYVRAFSHLDLYKNLFLMKTPYLIFDFLTAFILVKLASSKKLALSSYKLWMLNAVVIHSVYAVGGFDIIPAFFIVFALYAAVNKRPYMCIFLLSLGGATKLLPYILILPACLLLGRDIKTKFSLFIAAIAYSALIYLPFYLSSGNTALGVFALLKGVQHPGIATYMIKVICVTLYSFLCVKAIKDSRSFNPEAKLLYYFIAVLFVAYMAFSPRLRYFISVMPLLALIIPLYKRFGLFNLFTLAVLAFFSLTVRDLQLGLFCPINPDYFLGLPTVQEVMGRFIRIEMLYKISARILPIIFMASMFWIWRIKLREEGASNI